MQHDDSRTTAFGLWRYSKGFADAGDVVYIANLPGKYIPGYPYIPPIPAYYLMGHSIELSFKAFLRGHGVPVKELRRRPLGHDLSALYERAKRHQLAERVQLSPKDVELVHLLNRDYMNKRFEYIETGGMHVPD